MKQFKLEDRKILSQMLKEKRSYREITKVLGFSPSTISFNLSLSTLQTFELVVGSSLIETKGSHQEDVNQGSSLLIYFPLCITRKYCKYHHFLLYYSRKGIIIKTLIYD